MRHHFLCHHDESDGLSSWSTAQGSVGGGGTVHQLYFSPNLHVMKVTTVTDAGGVLSQASASSLISWKHISECGLSWSSSGAVRMSEVQMGGADSWVTSCSIRP